MFGIGNTIRAIAVLATVLIIAVGLWYVINIKADLAVSEANNKLLTGAVEDQKQLISKMQADIADIQRANKELHAISEERRREIDALSKKFSMDARGNPRDFGVLAAEKPELIERLINNASRAAARCFEIASGAPRTKQEMDARNSSEINKECPGIANPNYKPGTSQ